MLAYLTLFAWSFAAATILPLASEPMLIALVRTRDEVFTPVLIATAGNYLGACTTYWLARLAVQRLSPGVDAHHARAARLLARFGQPALLLSWVPLIGDAIVAVAGAIGVRFGTFSVWVIIAKLTRYAVVAAIAARV
jgi:membrane protein YqaA with SNARE-associated domain